MGARPDGVGAPSSPAGVGSTGWQLGQALHHRDLLLAAEALMPGGPRWRPSRAGAWDRSARRRRARTASAPLAVIAPDGAVRRTRPAPGSPRVVALMTTVRRASMSAERGPRGAGTVRSLLELGGAGNATDTVEASLGRALPGPAGGAGRRLIPRRRPVGPVVPPLAASADADVVSARRPGVREPVHLAEGRCSTLGRVRLLAIS